MTAISTCTSLSCRTKVEGVVERCPQCDRKMRTPQAVRRRGWLLLVVSGLLLCLIGYILIAATPMLLHPGELRDGSTFSGTSDQARLILKLLGALVAFGVTCVLNALFQVVTGRRHLAITIASLLAFAVVVYLGRAVGLALK